MKTGSGITFIDIDETLFRTTAKVKVLKGGKVLRELTNKEFNTYALKDGEEFDFGEFKDARLFKETSVPISPVVERVKHMISRIKETKSRSRIIVLTARKDLDDREVFLDAFRDAGIDVDRKDIIYIERSGNLKGGTTAERKKRIILKYLLTGDYLRCRLIDDDEENLNEFIALSKNLPADVTDAIKKTYGADARIEFYALKATPVRKLLPFH